ncbi:MAG: biotin/lipoyl-binding protein, partial [Anaerolineae bacterium]|nr:biotin/lipoyl-binding protein [Anaerolineae bacterium]
MRLRRILLIFLALAAVGTAFIFREQLLALGRDAWSAGNDLVARVRAPQAEVQKPLVASGMVEARTVDIASPTGGRIVALHVAEGQTVSAGDLIAELDTDSLDAQIAEAQAAVEVARAQLAPVSYT